MGIVDKCVYPMTAMMKLSGVLPIEKWPRLQPVLFIITFGLMLSFNRTCIVGNLSQDQIGSALITFSVTGTIFLSTFKYLLLRFRVGKIQKLFKDLDVISFDSKQQEVERGSLRTVDDVKFFVKLSSLLFCIGMGFVVIHPIFSSRRTLPMEVFFSIDYSRDFTKWMYLYVRQTFDFYALCLVTNLSEITPATVLIILNGHVRNLGYQLTNLPVRPGGAFNEAVKKWFIEYTKIKRACWDFQDIFSPLYFFEAALLSFNICGAMLALSLIKDWTVCFFYFSMISGLCFELFCPCFLGQLVLSRSEELQFRLYSASWKELKRTESIKGFLIFSVALRSPLSIRFGKIYILNLDSFKQILKSAYSLFTLAYHVISKQ